MCGSTLGGVSGDGSASGDAAGGGGTPAAPVAPAAANAAAATRGAAQTPVPEADPPVALIGEFVTYCYATRSGASSAYMSSGEKCAGKRG